jgi:hypothetical protein
VAVRRLMANGNLVGCAVAFSAGGDGGRRSPELPARSAHVVFWVKSCSPTARPYMRLRI